MNDKQMALFERDEALAEVEANEHLVGNWWNDALDVINGLPAGYYTGEDIRLLIEDSIGQPHHHNTYGALIRTAKKQGLISHTGQYKQMRTKKSHGRINPLYQIVR